MASSVLFLATVTPSTRSKRDLELLQSSAKSHLARNSHKRRQEKEQSARYKLPIEKVIRSDVNQHQSSRHDEDHTVIQRHTRAIQTRQRRPSTLATYQLCEWSNTGDTLLSKHTYHLYHHSATIFWPGFDRGSDKSHTPPFTLTWAAFRQQGDALFHSMMWQAAMHLSVIQKTPIVERESISYHHNAVLCIIDNLKRPADAIAESTLWAMLGIATQESGGLTDQIDMEAGFYPLGAELQWLDFYGRCPLIKSHIRALYQIIDAKGGLDALVMPGFFGSIQITDLFQSTHCLSKPHFPLAAPFRTMKKLMRASFAAELAAFDERPIGSAAKIVMNTLRIRGLSSQLSQLILDYRAFCLSTINGMHGSGHDLSFLAVQRNLIHHDLLCTIPAFEDIETWSPPAMMCDAHNEQDLALDDVVRTELLIFSVGVIFSISNLAVWQALILRLKLQIERDLNYLLQADLRPVLLWLCMIGCLATAQACDPVTQEWLVDILCRIEAREILDKILSGDESIIPEARAWTTIREELQTLVWSDFACDQGARLILVAVRCRMDVYRS